jgi:hypothetical protein
MSIVELREFFGWCSVVNIALMFIWFAEIVFMRKWIYKLHSRWFKLTDEQFAAMHYGLLSFFKLCVILFNIVPYFALRIIG